MKRREEEQEHLALRKRRREEEGVVVATWGSSYLHGSLQCLLDVHPLPHDGLVQLPLEGQQVHVGLRLWDQLTDLDGGGESDGTRSHSLLTSKAAVLK